jgi:uncharacterized membrane protein YfcA
METLIICIVALFGSVLTFFSGFGLGTLLLPIFLLFYPIDVAIACTAIVHLSNNIFKLGLIHKNISFPTVLKFGIPSIIGALAGVWILSLISTWPKQVVFSYVIRAHTFEIRWLSLLIGILMILFSVAEIFPIFKRIQPGEKDFIPGGLISGFFGGLSGHQGVIRSIFLMKLTTQKEIFISTGVAIACLVDIARLPFYLTSDTWDWNYISWQQFVFPVLSAIIGAIIGNYIFKKTTLQWIQKITVSCILLFSVCMILGLIPSK